LFQRAHAVFRSKSFNIDLALQEVTTWLILNGIKSEKVQFKMLCEQNMTNLWRKRALECLVLDYKKVGVEKPVDASPRLSSNGFHYPQLII
jgi:hypothetical protein